jgi:hypothetical protein
MKESSSGLLGHSDEESFPRGDQAMHASKLCHRRLFEATKDGIRILDADTGLINDANPFLLNLPGFVQLLERDAGPSLIKKSGLFLETISSAAQTMEKLIDDLLAFPHIGADGLEKMRSILANW